VGFHWPLAEIIPASSSSVSPETELMIKGLEEGGGFYGFCGVYHQKQKDVYY
jgi:hypothetical protein